MLNEREKRRPEFTDLANHVTMADGQGWLLPKPAVIMRPKFVNGRSAGLHSRTSFGPEFDELVGAVTASDPESDDIYVAAANVTAGLLLRNYALTDDELGDLFAFPSDAPGLMAALRVGMDTARGADSPKPSTGG